MKKLNPKKKKLNLVAPTRIAKEICDKMMGHNSIRCKETTHNPNALKRNVRFNFEMLLSYIMIGVIRFIVGLFPLCVGLDLYGYD